jgi:hypothetical protein
MEFISEHQWAITIIAAVLTNIVTVIGTWWLSKNYQSTQISLLTNQLDQTKKNKDELENANKSLKGNLTSTESQLKEKLNKITEQLSEANKIVEKYKKVRAKLENSSIVKVYYQPVVLVGPRNVGKSSLLLQWHAPWETHKPLHNQRLKTSDVPIFDIVQSLKEPHFAEPELSVDVKLHLILRVYDFPGELSAQQEVREIIIDETQNLRYQTQRRLGVVLILMFDAEEAYTGISDRTRDYYDGDLFNELRELVSSGQVYLERLILVFNKYDKLRQHFPNSIHDEELLKKCIAAFYPVYKPLRRACNYEKVCEVFTILDRDEMRYKNRGAPIVKGEAARAFVEAFAGREALGRISDQAASTYSSEKFL